jgi:hypothetical protein
MINKRLIAPFIFKVVLVAVGIALIGFYGMLLPAALVNFPLSFLGILYTGAGIGAGISCFIYLKKASWKLLIYIGVAFLMMAITLVNMYAYSHK